MERNGVGERGKETGGGGERERETWRERQWRERER